MQEVRGKERNEKERKKPENKTKMTDLSHNMWIIMLNVNGLNMSIKRQRSVMWMTQLNIVYKKLTLNMI